MSSEIYPSSITELVEAVRSASCVLPTGGQTKPALVAGQGTRISTTQLRGITEYDPSEFTFSALAGTPLKEIVAALNDKGQYLPFDPLLVEAGSTLGGAVASGLSGPGRVRFGGIRDFILGVKFVDGSGRLLKMGGKVVKNAAGFDLPKFFVGSMGKFGVLGELTFKVFPKPASRITLRLPVQDVTSACKMITAIGNARWEAEAMDLVEKVEEGRGVVERSVCVRLGGPASALDALAREVLARWPGGKMTPDEAERMWSELCEFGWTYRGGALVKVATTPAVLPGLYDRLAAIEGIRCWTSGGGNVTFVSLPGADSGQVGTILKGLNLAGLVLRGDNPVLLGLKNEAPVSERVKRALDPTDKFPGLED
jgi:glycolate oxidase FAD binding subunit